MKKKKKKVYDKGVVNPITGLIDYPQTPPIIVFEEEVTIHSNDL